MGYREDPLSSKAFRCRTKRKLKSSRRGKFPSCSIDCKDYKKIGCPLYER